MAPHSTAHLPELITDPDLPHRERVRIGRALAQQASSSERDEVVLRQTLPAAVASAAALLTGITSATAGWYQVAIPPGLVVVAAARQTAQFVDTWRRTRLLHRLEDRFVTRSQLDAEGQETLERAQRAVRSVEASPTRIVLRRQSDDGRLPHELWAIARSLHLSTELSKTLPGQPTGAALRQAVAERRDQVRAARRATLSRVEALEAYALTVAQADHMYQEAQARHGVEATHEAALDLLAAAAADDLAAADLKRMAADTAAVAEAFRAALELGHAADEGAGPQPRGA